MKAYIFDLDDTLYDERSFVFGAFKEVSLFIAEQFHLDSLDILSKIEQLFRNNGRGQIFNDIASHYDINLNIQQAVEVYRSAKPQLELYDDAKYFLTYLKENKFKTGIITDGCSQVQWNKIKALKVESLVNEIIVSDDFGKDNWKPSPFPYREMMKRLGTSADSSIYIGDNEHKDFVTARKLGMGTIRINKGTGDHSSFSHENSDYRADQIITSFDEISLTV